MVLLLRLVYQSVSACISEEINLDPYCRKDIKSQSSSFNHKLQLLCICVTNMPSSSGNYSIRHQVKFQYFFQLNEMRDEAKTWWLVFGPDDAFSFFFLLLFLKQNQCRTWITRKVSKFRKCPLLQKITKFWFLVENWY